MKDKIISPKIFNTESAATPNHDEFLIKLSRDSSLLKKYIECLILNEKKRKFNIFVGDDKAYREGVIKEKENKFYHIETETELHYGSIKYLEDNNLSYKKEFEDDLLNGKIKEIKGEFKEIICSPTVSLEITQWTPEKPIMSGSYYIGSVDLLVKVKAILNYNLDINNKYWKSYLSEEKYFEFIFEFKPQIKSYSETLRQVNVYKQHIPANYSIITYSDISKFQSIFESQGIKIYNP